MPHVLAMTAAFAAALGAAACSDATSEGSAATDLPSCAGATDPVLKVLGDVGGAAVDLQQPPHSGGFSQFNGGQFDTPANITINGMAVAPDPGDIQLHLTWPGLISDGSSGPASGTIVLPPGSPRAGETLCAGAGTRAVMPGSGDFVQFDLKALASGAGCGEPLVGRLRACWASGNH